LADGCVSRQEIWTLTFQDKKQKVTG